MKEAMTLGKALQLKKRLGQEIADAVAFRKESAWVTSTATSEPPEWLSTNKAVEELVYQYSKAAEMIILANCANSISLDGGSITLMSAIIMLDMTRKEIASLTKIIKDPNQEANVYARKTVDDVTYKLNFDRQDLIDKISDLKDSRDILAEKLAQANWSIKVSIDF